MAAMLKKALLWGLLTGGVILFPQLSRADVERYRPVPLGSGLVFILDTREGHAWTWQSGTPGNASASGENPRIVYQGNIRKNMKPPQGHPQGIPAQNASNSQRF